MRHRLSRPARMVAVAAISALVSSAALAPSSASASVPDTDTTPPPGIITVDLVNVNGSGCPAGSTAVGVADDHTAFTVTFDANYTAQAGPGIPMIESRKNCQLNVNVHVPGGITFAIAQADYRGYAYLGTGARMLQKASYYFQGNSLTLPVEHWRNGVFDNDWQNTDATPVAALVWRPCGEQRLFNINTELRVYKGSNPADTALAKMDSVDGSIYTVFHLAFRRCS